jgi:hypothetical protein
MLRIVTERHGDTYTIVLHGSMAGEWVGLLDRDWRAIVDRAPSATVTAVLSEVSFIDAEGERLLERMCMSGVRLVASGCMNRYVIEKVQARSARRADRRDARRTH